MATELVRRESAVGPEKAQTALAAKGQAAGQMAAPAGLGSDDLEHKADRARRAVLVATRERPAGEDGCRYSEAGLVSSAPAHPVAA